jgi:hypothetical protein
MRKIIFSCLFLSGFVCAKETSFIDYFSRFNSVFSSPVVSDDDLSRIVSYKVMPEMFINYDVSPPLQFKHKDMYVSGVMFNGGISKTFFMDYVKKYILNKNEIVSGNNQVYKMNGITYTFEIPVVKKNELVISEDILAPAPDDMTSEFSCTYHFKKTPSGVVMLSDVNCAG